MGNIKLASEYFSKVLTMLDKNEEQYANLEVAETLQSIGLMHAESKEFQKAAHHLRLAKSRFLSSCQDENHPKIQEILNQLQSIENHLG